VGSGESVDAALAAVPMAPRAWRAAWLKTRTPTMVAAMAMAARPPTVLAILRFI